EVAAREQRDDLRRERSGRRHRAAERPEPLEDDAQHDDRAEEQRIGRDRALADQMDEVEVRGFHRAFLSFQKPRAIRDTSFCHCGPKVRMRRCWTSACCWFIAMTSPPPSFAMSRKLASTSL